MLNAFLNLCEYSRIYLNPKVDHRCRDQNINNEVGFFFFTLAELNSIGMVFETMLRLFQLTVIKTFKMETSLKENQNYAIPMSLLPK